MCILPVITWLWAALIGASFGLIWIWRIHHTKLSSITNGRCDQLVSTLVILWWQVLLTMGRSTCSIAWSTPTWCATHWLCQWRFSGDTLLWIHWAPCQWCSILLNLGYSPVGLMVEYISSKICRQTKTNGRTPLSLETKSKWKGVLTNDIFEILSYGNY